MASVASLLLEVRLAKKKRTTMTCNKCTEQEKHTDCPNAPAGTTVVFCKGERIELARGEWIDDKPDADLDGLNELLHPPKE
jgi:hypothetical protein